MLLMLTNTLHWNSYAIDFTTVLKNTLHSLSFNSQLSSILNYIPYTNIKPLPLDKAKNETV